MFGVVMMLLVTLQVTYFPSQNLQAESANHEVVREDFAELLGTVYETADDGVPRTTAIQQGVEYPPQFTEPFTNPSVLSASEIDQTDPEVFINDIDGDGVNLSYQSDRVEFEPDYLHWQEAPDVVIEHGVIYSEYADVTITHSDQTLINDQTLSLATLDGEFSAVQRKTLTTTVQEQSTYDENTTTVTNNVDNTEVVLRTGLSESAWRELLEDERVANGGHIKSLDYTTTSGANELRIVLESGVQYTYRASTVSVTSAR
jgi:hypothetical protein